jgi:hypothetical protein
MDQLQLELNFESQSLAPQTSFTKTESVSAQVVNLSAIRKKKIDRKNADIYKSIIDSVKHINPENLKKFK